MANYNNRMDLMSMIGSQMMYFKARPRKDGETDEDYAKVPVLEYACIPTAFNDIKVTDDTSKEEYRNFSGKHAYLAFRDVQIDSKSKLLQVQRNRLLQNGEQETAYNVVCRDIKPAYTKEWQENMRRRYCAQIKAQHPEWASLEDQGISLPRGTERNELTRAISAKFPYSIGTGYLIQPYNGTQADSSPAIAPAQAQPAVQYDQSAVVDPFAQDSYTDDASTDALPF